MAARDTETARARYRIVVGVGHGGDTSEHAVREALTLATRGDDAELHVAMALAHRDGVELDRMHQQLLEEERWLVDYVHWVAGRTTLRVAPLHLVFHVRIGTAHEVLTQVAFDVGASMIIVGAHSRSRVAQLLSGSVAERLFTEGRYPLLVARPRDEEGLVKTPRPDPRRPGEPLRDDRHLLLESSDRVDFSLPPPHVSGLL